MRDYIVALLIFGSLPLILIKPSIGIIMWWWVSIMNPHRLTWGFMYFLPVAMIIGVATIAAWAMSRENKKVPINGIMVWIGVFLLWTGLSSVFALNHEMALERWFTFFKTIAMIFLTATVMLSRERLRQLIWVVVLSVGFFCIKGGLFVLATAGHFRVWGPPSSAIEDNNALALATLMVIPLMVYLARTATNRWIVRGLYLAAGLSFISVIGSYSRGALLGIIAIATVFWWRSRHKVLIAVAAVMVGVIGLSFVPPQWFERMETIQTYEEDKSAMSRIYVWEKAIKVANQFPILGAGLGMFENRDLHQKFGNQDQLLQNAHSIYFEVLGNHGWVGLMLFLAVGIAGLMTCGKIMRTARNRPELKNEMDLAFWCQLSLIAYAVSGTFLNLAMLDIYYLILTIIAINWQIVRKEAMAPATAPGNEAAGTRPVSFKRSKQPQPGFKGDALPALRRAKSS